MDSVQIESVAASLVREYLSRKGMKGTLQAMDDESPRDAHAISNRMDLAKTLRLEKLIRKNKDSPQPLRTFIEIMTAVYLEKAMQKQGDENGSLERPSTSSRHRNRHRGSDLIIDDDVEGETLLGDGKAGILDNHHDNFEDDDNRILREPMDRKQATPRRGLAGPITSSRDDRDRRMHRPTSGRPGTSSSRRNQQPTPGVETSSSVSQSALKLDSSSRPTLTEHKSKPKLAEPGSLTAISKPKLDSDLSIRGSNVFENGPVPVQSAKKSNVEKAAAFLKTLQGEEKKKPEDKLDFETALSRLAKSSNRRQTSKDKEDEDEGYSVDSSSIIKEKSRRPGSDGRGRLSKRPGTASSSTVGDVEMGDVDDDVEAAFSDLHVGPQIPVGAGLPAKQTMLQVDTKPLDIQTAVDLKTLIFGSASAGFSDEWKLQSFTFSDLPRLQYGIVQKKGGPCGLLASVQACMLEHLLFTNPEVKPGPKSLEPNRNVRSAALAAAFADILWRAGDGNTAKVTLPCNRPQYQTSSRCKADGVTEMLTVSTLTSRGDLMTFIHQNIRQFELDGQHGVILALYSAILSRSVPKVKSDMDVPTNTLMGAHGYCTQEMVNLFLSGRAVSNVFNDIVTLDCDDGPDTVLKGISERSDIGLLSLFEHYKSCEVGKYLKTPRFPIFVVCSESHFSVLFCLKRQLVSDWKAERRFDLYYWDGLGQQDHEIRLTIDTTNRFYQAPSDEELVPPLEHCIRTKWADAEVDWNGTEPLL